MKSNTSEIFVSICCITYNHEKYIAQAIDSFLMQQTNFRYEIIIGNDCSTDGTTSILNDYKAKYPDKIKLVNHEKNVGPVNNQISVFDQVEGKYIAFCDGDDFWTDPLKLQKQVDFLEKNPDFVICNHYCHVIDDSGQTVYIDEQPVPLEYTYEDLLQGKRKETRIGTLVARNLPEINALFTKAWYKQAYGADVFFKLHATSVTGKKIYVLPEVMSSYRHHNGGIYSMINTRVRKNKVINDFRLVVQHFTYSARLKRALLKHYVKDFFLFELRQFKISEAFNTLTKLI